MNQLVSALGVRNLTNPGLLVVTIDPPRSISEAGGLGATTATITRLDGDAASDASEIELDGSGSSLITVQIPDGFSSITIDVDAVNDFIADGLQTVFVTATAAGLGSVADFVEVRDNESAQLTVTVTPGSVSEVSEGDGAAAATGTVFRNSSIDEDLLVFLTSSDPSEALVPFAVVIPAGQTSASFNIDTVNEFASDGTRSVTVFATARGFFRGSDTLLVTADALGGNVTQFDRLGDSNLDRQQGQLLIQGNTISNVVQGIAIDASREPGSNLSHVGAVINLPTLNNQRLTRGAVIQNNVIHNFTQAGIFLSGDPNAGNVGPAAVPFHRLINNTIYGGDTARGIGVQVTDNAGPTLINNIIANTSTAISISGNSLANTVVGTTLFQGNTGIGTTAGSNAIQLAPGDPLFVDAAAANFYLDDNSPAIDSSLNRLADRPELVGVLTPLEIPASDIFGPDRDVFGQLRIDDPSQAPPPGLGFNIFKDGWSTPESGSTTRW
jgi:hypothetical protein